jgi:hypothetical protein
VLREAALDAVVIREDQSIAGHERSGAALEPHHRLPYAVEPSLVDREPVGLCDQGAREPIERPHPFVGRRGRVA